MRKHRRRRTMIYSLYMRLKSLVANIFFGFPTKDIVFLGVTGTDGKSTTCEMIYWILKYSGYKVGLLSTVHIDIGDGKHANHTKLTSLDHWDFCYYVRKAKDNGIQYMVLEVSSHALYQWRVWPVKFDAVGLTNLTREHLDFHRTMDHYFRTKALLFAQYAKRSALGIYPMNLSQDYDYYIRKHAKCKTLLRFGNDKNADIYADNFVETPNLSVDIYYLGHILHLRTTLLGQFNADNMMIAVAMTHYMGVSMRNIQEALNVFSGLPGRQELLVGPSGVTVMIDFALTPDALQTLYTSVRNMGYKRLIAVFGATGDRDKGKRSLMGKVATSLCDYVVLTEDENYSEDGMNIIKQIESGISDDKREKYCIVQDRKQAIAYAIQYAHAGDIVIVTGMGNFTSRTMNEGKIPWDEKGVIEEIFFETQKTT